MRQYTAPVLASRRGDRMNASLDVLEGSSVAIDGPHGHVGFSHACASPAPPRDRNTHSLQTRFSRLVRDREKGRRGVRKRPYCPTLGYGRIGTGGWNYATWFPNRGDRWACVEGGNGFASHVPVGQQTCHMRPGTAMARSCCVA